MIEPGAARRRWIAAAAFPVIEPDVMVIAAGGNKSRLRPPALHQLEAEHASIKVKRAIDIGDLEMDMADANAGIDGSCTHSASLCGRSAGERSHAQGGDAIARPAQHLKTKAVEREALSRLRDRASFVNDDAGDRSRFVVGNIPIHRAVEIANWHTAIDIDRAVRKRPHARYRYIVLVADVADNLFNDVFERNQPFALPIFIETQRKWRLGVPERFELLGRGGGVGHDPRRFRRGWNVDLGDVPAGGVQG